MLYATETVINCWSDKLLATKTDLVVLRPPCFAVSKPKPVSIAPPPDAVVGPGYIDVPHTNMRRTIAKRLAESKATVPHTYATTSCVMDNLLELRKGLDVKVSVNDFIIKAAALTLRQVPEMNAVWSGVDAQLLNDVDISIAVATDTGLITPIVKTADNLKLAEIASTLKVSFPHSELQLYR